MDNSFRGFQLVPEGKAIEVLSGDRVQFFRVKEPKELSGTIVTHRIEKSWCTVLGYLMALYELRLSNNQLKEGL